MQYCKGLCDSVIDDYESIRLNNPKYFGQWFVTCKKNFEWYFITGETYRIHDKAYDIWGAVSYEIAGHTMTWVKWKELMEYFEINDEMQSFT